MQLRFATESGRDELPPSFLAASPGTPRADDNSQIHAPGDASKRTSCATFELWAKRRSRLTLALIPPVAASDLALGDARESCHAIHLDRFAVEQFAMALLPPGPPALRGRNYQLAAARARSSR